MKKETGFARRNKLIVKDLTDEAPAGIVTNVVDGNEVACSQPKEAAKRPNTISSEKKKVKKGIARQIEGNIPDVDGEWIAINPDENPLDSLKILPLWVPFATAAGVWAILAVLFSLKEVSTIILISAVALIGWLILYRVRRRQMNKRDRWIEENPTVIRQEELSKLLDSDCDRLESLQKEIKNQSIRETTQSIGKTMKSMADNLEANPAEKTRIRKVVVHYVPMMIDLVEKYITLEKQNLEGDNVVTSMKSIEDGLTKVDASFKNYLDDMFADDKLDIQTDIKVMEQLLTKGESTVNKLDFDDVIENIK